MKFFDFSRQKLQGVVKKCTVLLYLERMKYEEKLRRWPKTIFFLDPEPTSEKMLNKATQFKLSFKYTA